MDTAIVGIVGAQIGVLLSNALRLYFDWRNRRERIRDIQTALQAEIRSHREALEEYEDTSLTEAILLRLSQDQSYSPLVPRKGDALIFDAIVRDIHILPGSVIDPIVVYYRQWRSLGAFVEDLRDDAYRALPSERKAEAFRDYVSMGTYAIDLADAALSAIGRSLRSPGQD